MHMADALITPAVGGTMWAAAGGLIAWCARKLKQTSDTERTAMMGVLGAFVFTAQMINFTIPATGSSGHLGGGLLLAALLGPHAAFLVIASILTVQALFFADGGLLALGCNIINLGFFPIFIAWPLFRRFIESDRRGTLWAGSIAAAIIGLQLGALAVVLQTTASGISELPFKNFLLMMMPIHLAIGAVEGIATAAVVSFVRSAGLSAAPEAKPKLSPIPVLLTAAVLLGGITSWFASGHADGLEWSIAKTAGTEELEAPQTGTHRQLADLQEKTSFLPDYNFKQNTDSESSATEEAEDGPVDAGTSVAGLTGGLLTLAIAGLTGLLLKPSKGN